MEALIAAIRRYMAASDKALEIDSSWNDSQVESVMTEYHEASEALDDLLPEDS